MEWLNYNHLYYFWTVAREGSVSRAGKVLYVTQPTVSTQLRGELERAMVVAEHDVDADIVTMNSSVALRDLDSDERLVYTLVFPRDASLAKKRISVLAPVGTAILGYRAGDVVHWKVPAGMRRLRIEKVLHQPEAAVNRRSPPSVLVS